MTHVRRRFSLDGSTSRTLILLAALAAVTVLTWHGDVNGEAFTGIVGAIIGAAVHASGTRQGSQASTDPPPDGV